MKLTIRGSNDARLTIEISEDATVLQLKEAIQLENAEFPVDRQRLIFAGRVLKDPDMLATYKITDGHTVHLVKGSSPAGSKPAPSAALSASFGTSATATTTATTPGVAAQPPNAPRLPNIPVNPFGMGDSQAFTDPFGANLGMAGLRPGGMGMDPSTAAQLLQDPTISNAVAQMMSDPQMVEAMLASSPQGMDPQARAMMQSPEFRAIMSNPRALSAMAQLQAAMMEGGMPPGGMPGAGQRWMGPPPSALPGVQTPQAETQGVGASGNVNSTGSASTPEVQSTGTVPTQPNPFAALFLPRPGMPMAGTAQPGAASSGADPNAAWLQSLLGGIQVPPSGPTSTAPTMPPEERYQEQLRQLNEMGFWDAAKNIRALTVTGGNVHAAVDWLLSNP